MHNNKYTYPFTETHTQQILKSTHISSKQINANSYAHSSTNTHDTKIYAKQKKQIPLYKIKNDHSSITHQLNIHMGAKVHNINS